MDTQFWFQKWENNEIAFHRSDVNPVLVNHFERLSLIENSRIFLPLCGKTLDIAWLLSQGYRVVGAELVETAIQQLFNEMNVEPERSSIGHIKRYQAHNLDIFVGNIFDIESEILGSVDAIYDRAALVALPQLLRRQYTEHLTDITQKAPQLLVTYEYDPSAMQGPPFSISAEEVNQYYGHCYDVSLLTSRDVNGGLKGHPAQESVWLLR